MVFWKVVYKNNHLFSYVRSLFLVCIYTGAGCGIGYVMKSFCISHTAPIHSTLLKNSIVLVCACIPALTGVGILLDITGIVSMRHMAMDAFRKMSRLWMHYKKNSSLT
jgi:hypothetical protein